MKIFSSFTARLYFYIILIVVCIFGSAAWIEYIYSSRHEYKQASRYTMVMLESIIKSVHLQLLQLEANVNFFASEVYLSLDKPEKMIGIARNIVNSDSAIMASAVSLRPGYYPSKGRLFMEYVTKDHTGMIRDHHFNDTTDYDYTSRDWYIQAVAHPGAGVWVRPYFDTGGGNVFMTTYTRTLCGKSGKPFSVVTADIELSSFVNQLEALRPFPESYVFILASDGTYVAHPDEDMMLKATIFDRASNKSGHGLDEVGREMIQGKKGSMKITLDGRELLICYAPLPHNGWSVACVTPYNAVVRRLGLASWTVLLIMLVGIVIMALVIRLLLGYMTDPLRQLVKAANRMATGDFNSPIGPAGGSGDLIRLRQAFVDMQANLRKYVAELTEATKLAAKERSIADIARTIQERMLPQSFPIYPLRPEIDIYGRMETGSGSVADMYDFHVFDDRLYFIISTADDRGILSSLMLMVTRSMFLAMVTRRESPAKFVAAINKVAVESDANHREGVFAGMIDYSTGELIYCNAGYPAPILRRRDGTVEELPSTPQPPCGVEVARVFVNDCTVLVPGDVVVAYSPGFSRSVSYLKEPYGAERLRASVADILSGGSAVSVRSVISAIFDGLKEHTGKELPVTDRSVISLAYRERPDAEGIVYANLTLKSTVTDIPRLSTFVDSIAARCGWPEQRAMKISLVFEEAVASIISYAYDDNLTGEIHITTLTTRHSFSLRLVDTGRPFDPTAEIKKMEKEMSEADSKSRGMTADKRAFGFFLINQIMDEMEYCRVGDENQLVMRIYF